MEARLEKIRNKTKGADRAFFEEWLQADGSADQVASIEYMIKHTEFRMCLDMIRRNPALFHDNQSTLMESVFEALLAVATREDVSHEDPLVQTCWYFLHLPSTGG